jgi:hypothetical protein
MRGMTDEVITKTTFRLPKSLLKDVQRYGIDFDMTDTEIFNVALREFLNGRSKNPSKR